MVYHGTKSDVDTFDLKKAGISDPGLVGKAVYLTPSPEQASAFAESAQYGKGDGPNVMPLFLSLKNLAMVLDGVMPNGMRLSQAQGRGIPGSALDARWVAEVRRQKEIPGHLHAIGRAPIARYGASEQAGNARDFRPSPETMKPP